MKNILLKYKGFTLIELLVVIAIIGILTAVVTANFTSAKSKARDAKRISDIAQLQLTLEQVFDKCGVYPAPASSANPGILTTSTSICSSLNMGYFISTVPTDPTNSGTYIYQYAVPSTSGSPSPYTDYVLRARLENNNGVLNDDVDGTSLAGVDCADTNNFYCIQPK
jgi:prepilin-type N-terminal cleavage/methylation domain-containing protein